MDGSPIALTDEEFVSRLVETTFANIDSTPSEARSGVKSWLRMECADPVAGDLQQLPAVLRAIDENWKDKGSLNSVSAERFSSLVCARASARQAEASSMSEIDVLVTGVENSHWIGQQFVADLGRVFPMLRCVALSSNYVLGMLQEGAGHVEPMNFPLSTENFRLSQGAVCLALSHSGTTYPTVWAARLLQRIPECTAFAMSGHLDTVLGASVGQSLADTFFHRAAV